MNPQQIICLFARLIVGGVVIYAGFSKAVTPGAEFAAALAAYKFLPSAFLSPVAKIWPWAELFTGTYLVFGFYTPLFARVAAGMFGVFLTVLVSALARGIDPGSCGCFGLGLSLSLGGSIALDSALLVMSFLLIYLAKKPLPFSTDAWIAKT